MSQPVRVQLSRKKGWRMPENTVVVARPTKWGNPFRVHADGMGMDAGNAVSCFRSMVEKEGSWFALSLPWPRGKIPKQLTTVDDVKRELRDKNLACWCRLCPAHASGKPLGVVCADCDPCHADVLLGIASGERPVSRADQPQRKEP